MIYKNRRMTAKLRLPFKKLKFTSVTLKNRSRSAMFELDLDLVQINVHTKFGDPRSIPNSYWAKTLVYTDKKLKFDLCDLEK